MEVRTLDFRINLGGGVKMENAWYMLLLYETIPRQQDSNRSSNVSIERDTFNLKTRRIKQIRIRKITHQYARY